MVSFLPATSADVNKYSALTGASSIIARFPGMFYIVLLTVIDLVYGTTSTATSTTKSANVNNDDNSGMLKGMAAGFGGFFGLIVLICVLWCCCCNQNESSNRWCCKEKDKKPGQPAAGQPRALADRARVGPSPPQSATTWSRSR